MSNGTPEQPRDLVSLLLASLEQLAAAGEVEVACRLAGQACALLRLDDPRSTQRFNVLLHRLSLSPAYATLGNEAADPAIQMQLVPISAWCANKAPGTVSGS